jgi:hypothetical protein
MNLYLAIDGKKEGPFSFEAVEEKFQSGELKPENLAWKSGFSEWKPLVEICPELLKSPKENLTPPKKVDEDAERVLMENDLEEEPESIASLMGIEASPPSADSPREGRFSALRGTGLCLALMVLSLFLWMNGFSLDFITFGSAITILLAGIAIPLVLLARFKKTFLSFVPQASAACFTRRAPNLGYANVSQWLGRLSLGIGTTAMVAGIGFMFFFYPDVEKLNSFGLPVFWTALLALILCNFSLFLKDSFSPVESQSIEEGPGKVSVGLIRRFLGFTKLSLGFILITLILFFGLGFLGSLVLGLISGFNLDPVFFIHPVSYFVYFGVPSLLLATYQKDFILYVPEAIAAFFSRRKPQLRFVEISRMGGKLAVFGAMLSMPFLPICLLPPGLEDQDWQSNPNGSNIAQVWPKEIWVGDKYDPLTDSWEKPLDADFRQIFEISESVVSARLRFLADSATVIVQINDQLVSEAPSDGQIIDLDVTSFLQKGENLISLKAVAEDRFPGIALKLDWTGNKGNGEALLTDESWKATVGDEEKTATILSFFYWTPYERLIMIGKQFCWTIYVGFLLWAVFKYLQRAFSEKK